MANQSMRETVPYAPKGKLGKYHDISTWTKYKIVFTLMINDQTKIEKKYNTHTLTLKTEQRINVKVKWNIKMSKNIHHTRNYFRNS